MMKKHENIFAYDAKIFFNGPKKHIHFRVFSTLDSFNKIVGCVRCVNSFLVFRMSTNFSGGLFDNVDDSKDAELAFKFAVQAINNQRNQQTDGLLEAGKSKSKALSHNNLIIIVYRGKSCY